MTQNFSYHTKEVSTSGETAAYALISVAQAGGIARWLILFNMKAILLTSSMTKIHQSELMFVFYLYFKPTKYMNLFNQLVVELRYYFMSTKGNTETH